MELVGSIDQALQVALDRRSLVWFELGHGGFSDNKKLTAKNPKSK
jgi:hypothetical protein